MLLFYCRFKQIVQDIRTDSLTKKLR